MWSVRMRVVALGDGKIGRDDMVEMLDLMGLEWGDEETAVELVDLLLQRFNGTGAWCWMLFRCHALDGTPLDLIQQGKSREVFRYARQMVLESRKTI